MLANIECDDNIFWKFRRYKESCKKIGEHQRVLCAAMNWFAKTLISSNEKLLEIIAFYEQSINEITITTMLFNKFELTADKRIITRIIEKLSSVLTTQYDLLEKFIAYATLKCKESFILSC